MDRRNFLAFIPTLGALPFIGTEIVKTKNKIEIFQPEEVPKAKQLGPFDYRDLDVRIYVGETQIGRGIIEQISMRRDIVDASEHYNDGMQHSIPGTLRWDFHAVGAGPLFKF